MEKNKTKLNLWYHQPTILLSHPTFHHLLLICLVAHIKAVDQDMVVDYHLNQWTWIIISILHISLHLRTKEQAHQLWFTLGNLLTMINQEYNSHLFNHKQTKYLQLCLPKLMIHTKWRTFQAIPPLLISHRVKIACLLILTICNQD